jgi:hypothetical protein
LRLRTSHDARFFVAFSAGGAGPSQGARLIPPDEKGATLSLLHPPTSRTLFFIGS